MFSVYIAAESDLSQALTAHCHRHPDDVLVMGSSVTLDQALLDCARDCPGLLLLDDRLVAVLPDPARRLESAPCPIILMAAEDIAGATQRAVLLGAKDLLTRDNWSQELLASAGRHALPLYPRDRKRGSVITVFSSKGGVGKTMLAVNLAASLASRHHEPVVIVDLDLEFGDVAPLLALTPQTTLYDVAASHVDPDILKHSLIPYTTNLSVLPAPQSPEQAEDVDMRSLIAIINQLREDYTFIVVDLSAGYHDANIVALDVSDVILTVCTPDVVTLRTVGQALSLFREDFRYSPQKVRLVINRTGSRTGIERSDVVAILKSAHVYELPSAGSMPVRAANRGVLFVSEDPAAPLSRAVNRIADDLCNQFTESPFQPARRLLRNRRHPRPLAKNT